MAGCFLSTSTSKRHSTTYQQRLSLPSLLPTSSFSLSLPFSLSEREISRNPAEELPDTSERRSPPEAQHGYNRNLHQIHRRVSAVRRARKVSDRTAASRVTHTRTLHCVSSSCSALTAAYTRSGFAC